MRTAQALHTRNGDRSHLEDPSSIAVPAGEAIAKALATPLHESSVVVGPPSIGAGSWAGAPSALLVDGTYWLAYRLREPIGRGFANVVARSDDGISFEPVAQVHRDAFGADSLERPTLALTDHGSWRLYVSCASPGNGHWRIDLLEAATPEGLATAAARTILPGSSRQAVKDPVIVRDEQGWHLWASCHPLDDPAHTARMTSEYATSHDGVGWRWHGVALAGRAGHWDARGVRVSAVMLERGSAVAFYDGRASAEENWEERTGVALGSSWRAFAAVGDAPVAQSPHPPGGLRYLSVVFLPDGSKRLYFELCRHDGAHELRTKLVSPGSS
jgi:hypothetical protein